MTWFIVWHILIAGNVFVLGMHFGRWLDCRAGKQRIRKQTERLADLVGLTYEEFTAPDCRECGRAIPGQLDGARCAKCIATLKRTL